MIVTNSMLIAQSMTNAFYTIPFTQSVPYQIYITGFVTNDSYTINKTCILHNKKIPNTIKCNAVYIINTYALYISRECTGTCNT